MIRGAIQATGRSINNLSQFSTVDRAAIGRFLKGERTITLETAQHLLDALGCTFELRLPPEGSKPVRVRRKRRKRSKPIAEQ